MITETELSALSSSVAARLSEKRFAHTKGVEEEIVRMGAIYLPDRIPELRAAALLHDVAKELPLEEQIAICREGGDGELETATRSPAILHGHAAAYLIPKTHPKYDLPEIISAIYKHTTGAEKMSMYLNDYINARWTLPDHRGDERYAVWDRNLELMELVRKYPGKWRKHLKDGNTAES